jgi:phosphinothricin acetyltransferase
MMRLALRADLPAVVAIYNAAIPGGLATADYELVSVESRQAWFVQHTVGRHPLWVWEATEGILGWLSLGPFYGRPAYDATAEMSVYVDRRARRQGIASSLLRGALATAPELGLETLLAFVFHHNQPSRALFERQGFEIWGRLPGVARLEGAARDLLILGHRLSPFPRLDRT